MLNFRGVGGYLAYESVATLFERSLSFDKFTNHFSFSHAAKCSVYFWSLHDIDVFYCGFDLRLKKFKYFWSNGKNSIGVYREDTAVKTMDSRFGCHLFILLFVSGNQFDLPTSGLVRHSSVCFFFVIFSFERLFVFVFGHILNMRWACLICWFHLLFFVAINRIFLFDNFAECFFQLSNQKNINAWKSYNFNWYLDKL